MLQNYEDSAPTFLSFHHKDSLIDTFFQLPRAQSFAKQLTLAPIEMLPPIILLLNKEIHES